MLVDVAKVIAPDLHTQETRWYEDCATREALDRAATLLRWLAHKCRTNNWEADDYARILERPDR